MRFGTLQRRLVTTTMLAGAIALSGTAQAQDQTPAQPAAADQATAPSGEQTQASAGPPATTSSGDVVVTGSLIRNPALVATAPVQVLGQEEVQLRQSNTAEEILRDLPGAVADIGSAVNNGNTGFANVNLRGLGSNRNLVLLDGNRIAPADLVGVVDLNDIPLALIQRTEVLTGGASTTYGADAISGVVNFITRSDFTGVEASASNQITQRGDGPYFRADLTVGGKINDGRGNAVVSIGYQHSDPIYQGARDFSGYAVDSYDGTGTGSGTTTPTRFLGIPGIGTRQINPATGSLVTSYSFPGATRFNYNPYNLFQVPFKRYNLYAAGHYDITDDITVYTRGMYAKNEVQSIVAPGGAFNPLPVVIPFSNPYLPAPARTQLCGAYGLSTAQCNAAAVALSPSNPNYRTFALSIARRAVELGPRDDDYKTEHFDYRLGVRGNISSHLHFDINGSYGESSQTHIESGYYITAAVQDALLATNTTTCLSGNTACVPLNIFGAAGTITPAMNNYLTTSTDTFINTSLGQARGVLSGDVGVTSPFATAPIDFAAGVEYRKYRASLDDDLLTRNGGTSGNTPLQPFSGGYDVVEGFGELTAPLVQDRPFFQNLELNGGVRYSHYNVAAPTSPSYNTTTWKGGTSWQPIAAIRFRGVYQHAVRAPNINELFAPAFITETSLTVDPCAGAAPTTNANLRAVCVAQGASPASIGLIDQPSASQVNATLGGNINLTPEKSNSYTLGVVVQPKGLASGLSITADYYHIKIAHAISQPGPSDVINGCFANLSAASATSPACTGIRRDASTGQLVGDGVTGLPFTLSNSGRYLTDGIDLGLSYRRDLGFALLNASFEGNWTHRSIFQATPLSLVRNCVGFYSANCPSIQPKFSWIQRTTLSHDGVDLSLLWRHINRERQEPDDTTVNGVAFAGVLTDPLLTALVGKTVNFGRIPAFNYLDLSLRASVTPHFEFTVTVQNLLDKQPPITGSDIGYFVYNSGNTYPSTYDALGRRFAIGGRLKF
ncbi:TonB-dependent receptor plug domain-containing protein [Sphingomonas bacterium]|uniref:TonB-dependent receptor plug domain-containing protein n=1 Tax=Sphingomonas bacterium TaxID=1895847 RepID=UPI001577183C|nr:TonB-dependent receptor [Sphingomonas bacterium]